jgi:ATP:ADP antiporter, AAA family
MNSIQQPARDRYIANVAMRILNVERQELAPALLGMLMFLLLFCGYFMLRPVRETMGITGGVQNLHWLFTGTFIATLIAMPLFGGLAAHASRRRILHYTLFFFALNLVLFALLFSVFPNHVWLARSFYIWLSVFSLLAVSVTWSTLADLFRMSEAKRLFALMAVGASIGGLLGPLLGAGLVGSIGHAGLLALAALLLLGTSGVARRLQHWRDRHPASEIAPDTGSANTHAQILGGSPFAGAALVLRSPFLLANALFVILLASSTTFLYFEQARLIAIAYPNALDQTRVFSLIDATVQALAIVTQLFFTGRLAHRFGVTFLLVALPLLIALGFVWLALMPAFSVLVVVMIARRAGEYALVRPGREMLFTFVSPTEKYKAKNFIDTVVYRGADALSAWLKTAIELIAQQPGLAAMIGALIALLWAASGVSVAKIQRKHLAQR